METKHTPGPWNFDGHGINAKGERILKVQYQRHDGNGKISERFDADSNLAAAAPELIESLKWFVHIVENTESIKKLCLNDVGASVLIDARRQAIAAIDKATCTQA